MALAAGFSAAGGLASAAQINTYGKLVIAADDYSFSARLKGRLHMDGDFYRSGSDDRALTSGTFVRRARIGIEGNFREWEYSLEFDNAEQQSSLKDAFVRRLIGPGKVTFGQFKVFESIEEVSSSNDTAFIERSYVAAAVPGFKIGAAYHGAVKMVGFSGNVYNMREASEDEARPTNAGVGAVARGYFSPVHKKTMAVHLGMSYAQEYSDRDGMRVRVSPIGRADEYRNGEEFRFELFDRRDEHAQIHRANLEAAAINGPLYVQGEYLKGMADTKTTSVDRFNTWYAQVCYVITGQAREYEFRDGRVQKPNLVTGAFEAGVRYQRAERENADGAVLTATEFGLTYYANVNVRFMANYGWTDNKLINDKPRLLSTRVQFDF